jgi:hypothetical protein
MMGQLHGGGLVQSIFANLAKIGKLKQHSATREDAAKLLAAARRNLAETRIKELSPQDAHEKPERLQRRRRQRRRSVRLHTLRRSAFDHADKLAQAEPKGMDAIGILQTITCSAEPPALPQHKRYQAGSLVFTVGGRDAFPGGWTRDPDSLIQIRAYGRQVSAVSSQTPHFY